MKVLPCKPHSTGAPQMYDHAASRFDHCYLPDPVQCRATLGMHALSQREPYLIVAPTTDLTVHGPPAVASGVPR